MSQRPAILPLAWLSLAIVAMVLLHVFWPLGAYLSGAWRWLGSAPLAAGVLIMVLSARRFTQVDTGLIPFDEARVLVTDGCFRWTRNPMYLGMVMILAGLSLMMGSVSTLIPIPPFVIIIRRNFILPEERFMENAFGQRYLDYRARVRRWL